MDPVEKALWYIEAHFESELSVDEIARVAGVSRFHLTRLFTLLLGQSAMQYARARRLTQAARTLADGAPDILAVALAHGYGSHEAFTRAFRDHFGATPETVRAQGSLDSVSLQEPIRMYAHKSTQLTAPRFEQREALLIAGIGARYAQGGDPAIPSQWQRFAPHIGHVPHQTGDVAYGVGANFDDEGAFDLHRRRRSQSLRRSARRLHHHSPAAAPLRRVHASRSCVQHSRDNEDDLGRMAAVVRPQVRRRPVLRALRRPLQPSLRQRRGRVVAAAGELTL
jgi:AraC-like DNA-binding protein